MITGTSLQNQTTTTTPIIASTVKDISEQTKTAILTDTQLQSCPPGQYDDIESDEMLTCKPSSPDCTVFTPRADLRGCNLRYTTFDNADLISVNFIGANLTGATFRNSTLVSAFLISADLKNADLTDANLKYALLKDADFTGANLTNANLSYAQMANIKLLHADLTRANLYVTSLLDADLSHANLSDANLSFADLIGAKINGTFANPPCIANPICDSLPKPKI
jgi:uncharacterized protein YjbI with pentapeptide repeats